ncbi:TatD family hydrolase [Candidatus Nomurabacteria bacterium]|nr:TatD family hydrolase [Candidatus Nomurabacteria bacterium]
MTPEYIDIHSHLTFPDYNSDKSAVIERLNQDNIWTITIGTDFGDSKKCVEEAEKYEGVFACIGQHPADKPNKKFDYDEFKKLSLHPKVVAIGECGLDFFRPENQSHDDKKRQIEIFEQHIQLSIETGKPLMIHCRNAYDEVLEILNKYHKQYGDKLKGNAHFFAGTLEQSKKFLEIGFTLSFTGVITFANQYDEIIKYTPLDKIMSETDAPFVAPVPYRGKRNEPSYVVEVVKKIAEIKGENFEIVKNALCSNAKKVFKL